METLRKLSILAVLKKPIERQRKLYINTCDIQHNVRRLQRGRSFSLGTM